MEKHTNERRRFLEVVSAGAVALGAGCSASIEHPGTGTGGEGTGGAGTGGEGTGTTTTTTTTTSCTTGTGTQVGTPSEYTTTGLHIVTDKGVLIGRDAGGLYALTSVCTHQGCDMSTGAGEITGQDITCRCHYSEFGPTGAVLHGPANRPLNALELSLGCDGNLYVDKSKIVASTVRLMV